MIGNRQGPTSKVLVDVLALMTADQGELPRFPNDRDDGICSVGIMPVHERHVRREASLHAEPNVGQGDSHLDMKLADAVTLLASPQHERLLVGKNGYLIKPDVECPSPDRVAEPPHLFDNAPWKRLIAPSDGVKTDVKAIRLQSFSMQSISACKRLAGLENLGRRFAVWKDRKK